MPKSRSFKSYVFTRFYNEFFEAVESFILNNRDNLGVSSQLVVRVDEAELDDIDIKHAFINDLPDMKIAFDVLIEAFFEIHEVDRRNDRYDEVSNWFKVSCTGDLDKNLDDFKIKYVEIYSSKDKQTKPLSDTLVPIIYKEQLEKVAEEFLQLYFPETLTNPTYIDPNELAEKMGLKVEHKQITDDFSVFGQIFFVDTETKYYDNTTSEYKIYDVSAGTIFVDPTSYFLRNLGSVHNTIVHECAHWHLHRKAFKLERLFNNQATQIQCKVIGGVKDSTIQESTDFMEWQANALAPRIQMPLNQTKIKASEYIRKYLKLMPGAKLIDIMEAVIDEIANFFMVSRLAAKIRMIDAGYEEARGTFNYVDGKYVKPYTFKKGSLERNQTFSISEKDALIQSFINPSLKEKLNTGNYIFVDSHFCINHPKYIQYDLWGQPALTDYARYNLDECALAFDIVFDRHISNFNEEFYFKCILFKDAASDITFRAEFSNSTANDDVDARAKAITNYSRSLSNVLYEMPGNFQDALIYLMQWRELTTEDLAEKSLLSTRTIDRLRAERTYNPSIETVIAVCIGLQLHPMLSNKLISLTTSSLGMGEIHVVYNLLLTCYYTNTIHECNSLLVEMGHKPLVKDKDK